MKSIIKVIYISALLTFEAHANTSPYAQMLPVSTPGMKPGKVAMQAANHRQLRRPIFIVGDDLMSFKWLTARHKKLKSINAIGMAVNVRNVSGLNRLQQFGLPIYPVKGNDFAKAFNINRYPVLIESSTISQ
jgi:integrating conjugative element protein (TIGR03765 family)